MLCLFISSFFSRCNLHIFSTLFSSYRISGMFEFLKPIYFIRDPKLVKKIAVKDFEHFVDHRTVVDESMDKLFGKALLSLKGQKWKDMRSTLSPMFTGSKMRMMYEYVAKIGQQTAATMKEQIKNGSSSEMEFKDLASKFTVDVIASTAFGIEVNSFVNPDNDFQIMAEKISNFNNLKTSLKLAGFMIMPWIMKTLKITFFGKEVEVFFHEAVTETMKIREEQGIIRNDMINLLMQAKKGSLSHDAKEDEKHIDGFATAQEVKQAKSTRVWDDDDLAAQCFLFFLGGFDTVNSLNHSKDRMLNMLIFQVATTMSFMAHELAVNPDAQQKLYEEIKEMNDDLDGKMINYEQIQKLKYLDQVLCETLRLWPPAPVKNGFVFISYKS
jgi:cytochrome P450 family 9